MFHRNDYLDWYVPRVLAQDGSINLHSSGVAPVDLQALDFPSMDPWTLPGALEESLAEWLGIDKSELLFVHGATGGTLHALLCLAQPGRGMVVESPIYEPMLRQAQRLGSVTRIRRKPQRGWGFDLEEAEQVIGPDKAVVMVTEPHNPSGCFAPREHILSLAELAARQDAYLLVNEVYRGWSDRPSFHGAADNIVVVNSLSKLCGTYALRIGWLSAAPRVISRLRACLFNTGRTSVVSAGYGLAVMQNMEARIAESRKRAAMREIVDQWVGRTDDVSWVRPQGPGFGLLKLPDGIDDRELVERLHRDEGVLAVPGSLWESPGAIRLGWLQTDEQGLRSGLDALARVLGG